MVLAGLAFAGVASAAPLNPVDPLLARLDVAAKGVTSLSGEFTQKNKIKIFKQEVRSKGKFYFERPRRIRWEYLEPDPSTLVLDGDRRFWRVGLTVDRGALAPRAYGEVTVDSWTGLVVGRRFEPPFG